MIAIAAGYDHTMAVTADKRLWTWGDNGAGQLGRTGSNTVPGQVANLSNVVAIAGGNQFSLAATSNGLVYGFGDNTYGQLGTNGVSSSSIPIRVAGISNAVLVSTHSPSTSGDRPAGGHHSLAITVDEGTNHYWGWGGNESGQTGSGTNGANLNQYAPVPVQFCTRCQRCVQLGTSGVLTAQCTGTLVLYFNDDLSLDYAGSLYQFEDNSNQFAVAISGISGFSQTNVPASAAGGIAVGAVTNGGVYPYTATGLCYSCNNSPDCVTDADGKHGQSYADCSSINITNSICPAAHCFSLVGKIQ